MLTQEIPIVTNVCVIRVQN